MITPLNWGLGHATRCIPIIKALQDKGVQAMIASDGASLSLLKKEFPKATFFSLPSYNIQYKGVNMIWNMMRQAPSILSAIRQENKRVREIVKREKVDIIISDNRFGCYHPEVHNVFISHQLNIQLRPKILRGIVNQINRHWISNFQECWVPDYRGEENLSGSLSHPSTINGVSYLGPLSRMQHYETEEKFEVLIVLSGPEPQRSVLEKLVVEQMKEREDRCMLIRGVVENAPDQKIGNLEIISYLTSKKLNELMLSAKIIVCRSGYSTLMDLAQLRKKALLIPTPGQTEQEYLAQRLMEKGLFYAVPQKNLQLRLALKKALGFSGFASDREKESLLERKLKALLSR